MTPDDTEHRLDADLAPLRARREAARDAAYNTTLLAIRSSSMWDATRLMEEYGDSIRRIDEELRPEVEAVYAKHGRTPPWRTP